MNDHTRPVDAPGLPSRAARAAERLYRRVRSGALRQGTGTIADQGFYSVTNFLTGVLLARALVEDQFGVYVLALSIITAIMGLQRALISMPYTILSKDHRGARLEEYAGSAVLHQIVLSVAAAGVGVLFFGLGFSQPSSLALAGAFAVASAGVLTRDFVRFLLLASLNVRGSLLVGALINSTQLLALLLLVVTRHVTMLACFLVIGSCSLAPSLFVLLTRVQFKWVRGVFLDDLRRNLGLGKWMVGSSAISLLSSQAYVWLLLLLVDKKSVAVLGVASSLANLLSPLLQGVAAFLLPKMVHVRENQGAQGIMRTAITTIALLASAFAGWLACAILFGDHLLTAIYSDKYTGYGTLLVILILYSLVSAVMVPVSAALDALRQSAVSFKASLAALAVTLLFGVLLIQQLGVYGAALAALLANVTNLALRWRGLVESTR